MAKEDEKQEQKATDPALVALFAQAAGGMAAGVEEGFGKTFPYPVRPITGVAKELSVMAQLDIQRGRTPDRLAYGGHLLVNEKGVVARQPYDPEKDARRELFALKDDVQRASILSLLHSRGFYGDSKPSQGALTGVRFEYEDLNAMASLLYVANSKGSTWQPVVAQVAALPSVAVGGGGGSRVRVTSSEDLGVYLREESFRQLGRNLTRQELQQAILGIQNQQRQRAASSMDAPNVEVAAEQAVSGVDPARRSAMKLGRALELLFSGGR